MTIYEVSALATACLWAVSGLLSAGPSAHLGAIEFSRIRMSMVLVMLCIWVAFSGGWKTIGIESLGTLAFSGFIGIFVGDTALFLTMNRLGPRRTAILYSMNAAMSTLLGWVFLDETLEGREVFGILIVLCGVILAILFGKRKSQLHKWEEIKGPLWVGVSFGLVAALCQSVGSLVIRPLMETGIDPVASSALRVAVSVLCFSVLVQLPFDQFRRRVPADLPMLGQIALSGFLAMALGMTFILFALSGGEVGIVATLSATTPALVLPIMWWRTGEFPALGAWAGAALAVIGSALIFSI